MNKKLRALIQRKTELAAKARAITDAAEADNARDLTEDEQTNFDSIMSDIAGVNSSIEREQQLIDAENNANALHIPDDSHISGGDDVAAQSPTRGFNSYGEYLLAVRAAGLQSGQVDQRLLYDAAAPSTYGSEGVGADGGFLIPPEYSREIFDVSMEGDSFMNLTDDTPISGNSMVFPADETTPWGTDGIRAYWEDEADAATATKPKLEPRTLRLKKLMALVPVTDELMADAMALSSYLTKKTGQSIRWKANDSIVNGSGVGKPKGVANAGSLVVQAKETSQTADTINANNVAKMFARMPAGSLSSAYWLISNDSFNQLITMTVGNAPIWTPPSSGMVNAPAGLLLGRPIIMSQSCQTLGDQGDIYFIDFKAYRTITKAGGIETATSMHLYFDAGATAFRATFRVDGEPSLRSAISPANGSTTLSPFVTLAARA